MRYIKRWERWHKGYEKRATKEIQAAYKTWLEAVDWDNLSDNYESELLNAMKPEVMLSALTTIYTKIGEEHGLRIGKDLGQQKEYTESNFISRFQMEIQKFLNQYGTTKIVTIRKTLLDEVYTLIKKLSFDSTIPLVSKEIQHLVNKPTFTRWMAERIARTESTAAANKAATVASGITNFVTEKVWLSGLDGRVRAEHSDANGQTVLEGEKFIVGGEEMEYPGDPSASAWNVINCRCTVAVRAKRDRNGNLIMI